MSVALLLVTHGDIGRVLLDRCEANLGPFPQPAGAWGVGPDDDPDAVEAELLRLVSQLDAGDGVLVLADLYGATPSNVAQRLADDSDRVECLHGLNLPMLVRAHNYPDLPLYDLAERLLEGGHRGIVLGRPG